MSKKLFVLLVALMSLSLIGIIFVQAYYINNTVENEEQQFTFNVQRGLSYVSKEIEEREFTEWTIKFQQAFVGVDADSTSLRELLLIQDNDDSNETLIYKNAVLEENYKLSSSLFDIGLDSITIMRIINERETRVIKNDKEDKRLDISPEALLKYDQRTKVREIQFETTYRDNAKFTPIHKRATPEEIEYLLSKKLKEDGIDIDFEFAIYDNDLATKVQSENFELDRNATYGVPIFLDNNDESDFSLYVNFPERKKFILSSILGMMLLSIVFTTIIIIAYTSAIYQLIKQRQISQIKTDFINNMTHEFKTPIATINLALDAIRNPKIIEDKEKVQRYLGMIKDENKRMHAQVENVLRISKLEKNELNISKERVKLHDLIQDAIGHIELIVEDKQGYVQTHFEAQKSSVLANETHFTNVIVNMLDNAVKYSSDAPMIDVHTENVGNNIIMKIKDQGSGMSKAAQKKVFDKFYREHTGDIHNVKGHGLGLAYVKRIVDDHQGHVSVESEKGKGSTFIIKLPLIS
ncbi:MAG: HAMP domain-containing histidine kinase [Bacteroidia bacterium]|nr:HAMP domain-containing histidine kinase [Bacteroidia bacterium]MBT8310597.1 HAMP domain-containing histidine kinase [Bacteroidia bacterium]NND11721.1 HAMP domain-containing histidine kinase [Flavobacteriaceae bacterium]NNL60631.1 HAMP domain-containing histidine kinase [Flavobacteriaceae bacterium]